MDTFPGANSIRLRPEYRLGMRASEVVGERQRQQLHLGRPPTLARRREGAKVWSERAPHLAAREAPPEDLASAGAVSTRDQRRYEIVSARQVG